MTQLALLIYCPACRAVKTYTEFHVNRTTRTGRQSFCQPCMRAVVRAGRAAKARRAVATAA